MKKKVLCIGLAFALALTIFTPASVAAKKIPELFATGIVDSISEGSVKAAGNSGRWVVEERDIRIDFGSDYALEDFYTLSYHANVDTDSENLQVGHLRGILVSDNDDITLNVRGTIDPAELIIPNIPLNIGETVPIIIFVGLYVIHIEGGWTFTSGGQGNGTFGGNIYVLICEDDKGYGIPLMGYDLDGHVISLYPGIASTFSLYD